MRLFKNKKDVYIERYDPATDEFVFENRKGLTYRVAKSAVTDERQLSYGDYAEGAWILLLKTEFNLGPNVGFPYKFPISLAQNNEGFPLFFPIQLN